MAETGSRSPRAQWLAADDSRAHAATLEEVSARPGADAMFVSAHWLEACMKTWPAHAGWQILRLHDPAGGDDPIALIGRGTQRRHRVVVSRVLALNQSTLPDHDECWIELNGFFGVPREHFPGNLDQTLRILERLDDWDELRLPGLLAADAATACQAAKRHGLIVHVVAEQPGYSIDLERVRRDHAGDPRGAWSANTRQQVRRAVRDIGRAFGPVSVERAGSAREAFDWFLAAGPWHKERWSGRTSAPYGGFDNRSFVAFHRALIDSAFAADRVDFLRMRAGDRVFAYLYMFRINGIASFYLGGIDYGIGEKLKPGLVAHDAAIHWYLDRGAVKYDFLAGEARYKSSLSTDAVTQHWLVLQRPRLRFRIEHALRTVKGAVARWQALHWPHRPAPNIKSNQAEAIVSKA